VSFTKIDAGQGIIFLQAREITFTCMLGNCDFLEVKNVLVHCVHCVTDTPFAVLL
jgi:hypothetical protein